MKEIMQPLHNTAEIEAVIQQPTISILTFSAEWCPDCHFIKPFMPKLVDEFRSYMFYYIDRDECMDTAKNLMIMGIPSFVAFQNGQEIARFVSKNRKSEQEIRAFLYGLNRG